MLGLAAVVAIAAVVLIGTGGGDDTEKAAATPTPAATTQAGTPPSTATPQPTPTPQPPLEVEVKANQPVEDVPRLEVDKGDRVRFVVSSDEPDEVHAHGYDITKEVAPGRDAAFDFRAKIDGIFAVELEGAGRQVLELRIYP